MRSQDDFALAGSIFLWYLDSAKCYRNVCKQGKEIVQNEGTSETKVSEEGDFHLLNITMESHCLKGIDFKGSTSLN